MGNFFQPPKIERKNGGKNVKMCFLAPTFLKTFSIENNRKFN